MSRLVVAGAWTIETNNAVGVDIVGSQPLASRLNYMAEVLKTFDTFCTTISAWKTYSDGVLYVFVAPEYYFKSGKIDVERCLSKGERDGILKTFKKLSFVYPHTVIIPGTIIWSKPADEKARKKAQTRMKETMQTEMQQKDQKNREDTIKPHTWDKYKQLLRRGPNEAKALSYNSAYIFYNGSIYKYHKMNDATENLPGDLAQGTLFIPGSKPGYFPNLGKTGLAFGIEICADHKSAVLNQTVDIHVVSSASTTAELSNIRARSGGLFVHASSRGTQFYVNNAGNFEAPEKSAGIPYHAKDLLTSGQLKEQGDAFMTQKEKTYGAAMSDSYRSGVNVMFNTNATRGRLDCWVTEMN